MSKRKDFVGSMYATTTAKNWGFGPVSGKRCVTEATAVRRKKRNRESGKTGRK